MRYEVLCAAVVLSLGAAVSAQSAADLQPELVKDITPGNTSTIFSSFTAFNEVLLFQASDPDHGRELWRSDGTAVGTYLLKDIVPGPDTSDIATIVAAGDRAIFFASTPSTGKEPFSSDGNEGGTGLAKDIRPGFNGSISSFNRIVSVGGRAYFPASNTAGNDELWASDGTADGTYQVKEIVASNGSPNIEKLYDAGGRLLFTTNIAGSGRELWTSDGTESGTFQLREIFPGGISGISSVAGRWAYHNGTTYFIAQDDTRGLEVWQTDGTTSGTQRLSDTNNAFISSERIAYVNGRLLLAGRDDAHGSELWSVDTITGTSQLLKEFVPGQLSSTIGNMMEVNGLAFFRNNSQLWVSDGTAEGTISLGAVSDPTGVLAGTASGDLVVPVGDLFFFVRGGVGFEAFELWATDGTLDGTFPVYDNQGTSWHIRDLRAVGNTLYFSAPSSASGGVGQDIELWKVVVPEPGAAAFLACAPLLLMRRFRRRHR